MGARTLGPLGIALASALSARAAWSAPPASVEACATTAETGMDARQDGRFADALAAFRSCAADACPDLVKNDCRSALAELSERGPRLSFRVRDAAGHDVPDARVLVNGAPLSKEDVAQGVLLNAGTHRVEVRAHDAVVRREVVVAAGDAARTVEVEIGPLVAPGPRVASTEVDLVPAAVVGGVAAAALTVAGVLGVWSYVDFRSYEDGCSPRCDPDDVSASRARGLAADVALGIGLNAAVAATILIFAGPKVAAEGNRVAFRF
jgi:hypothetical protein